MKYLVDTNVLSEPTKLQPSSVVIRWLKSHESELILSPIVLGELQYGILLLPAGQKRARLLKWFAAGVPRFPVLDFDSATAEAWAQLLAQLKRNGKAMPIKDSLIAATAKQHHLAIATRNTNDFEGCGIPMVNPWETDAG